MFRSSPLLVLLAVSACATRPVPLSEARGGAEHFHYQTTTANTAPVYIRRDSGYLGSACSSRVYVNGELSARLGPRQVALLHIPAGRAILGAELPLICRGALVEQEVSLVAGKPAHFRIAIDGSGGMGLFPTATR